VDQEKQTSPHTGLPKRHLKIIDNTDDELHEFVRRIYKTAYAITGYKYEAEKVREILIPTTVQIIKQYHRRREMDEVFEAVKKGALGEYGDYQGITPKTIHRWIAKHPKKEREDTSYLKLEAGNPDLVQTALDQMQEGHKPYGLSKIYAILKEDGRLDLSATEERQAIELARDFKKRMLKEVKNRYILQNFKEGWAEDGPSFRTVLEAEMAYIQLKKML